MTEFAPAGNWQTPLDAAYAFLGVQEEGGPNRGPMIDIWLRFVNLEPKACPDPGGYPWCAAFVSWCCFKGNRPIVKGSSARKLLMRNGDIEVAEPVLGDICINMMSKGKGHVAFYIKRDRGRIYTIDGNSNDTGSRDGRDVALVDRPVDWWDRFLRPGAPA